MLFCQTVYFDVDDSPNRQVFISVITKTAASRAYNIRVKQFKELDGPYNCLQYYTEPNGYIQTFNYEDAGKFVEFRNPSYFVRYNFLFINRTKTIRIKNKYFNQYRRQYTIKNA